MGFDLLSLTPTSKDSECFYLNWDYWRETLRMAFESGWGPAGTVMEYHDGERLWRDLLSLIHKVEPKKSSAPWDGTYFSNDGQIVIPQDAQGLADALSEAIAKFSCLDRESLAPIWEERSRLLRRKPQSDFGGCDTRGAFDLWCDPSWLDYMREFVQFCRQGGFWIT